MWCTLGKGNLGGQALPPALPEVRQSRCLVVCWTFVAQC
jgi:hypothetical protein